MEDISYFSGGAIDTCVGDNNRKTTIGTQGPTRAISKRITASAPDPVVALEYPSYSPMDNSHCRPIT